MLAETGLYALILGLMAALLQAFVPFAAPAARQVTDRFVRTAATTQFVLVAISFAALITAHAVNDFSVLNVVENSHTGKPLIFAIAGAWGNHEGSMLLWGFVLSAFGAAFAVFERRMEPGLRTTALALHGLTATLFLGYILFASSPFARVFPVPLNGLGLNPLLQDIGLALHPPLLYLGYVGFSVVFALTGASLLRGDLPEGAVSAIRRWCLIAWLFLTLGIGFGAWWSYYTLGWGGFWSWDPVENAALMPWLTGLALIHACGPAREGALKRWTMFLALSCFVFSLLGTFLVRSGVLVSVHSFATDPLRGMVILGLLAILAGGGYLLFALRCGKIRNSHPLSLSSREGGLAIASLLAAASALIVAVGTLYPLVLEGLTGARISVGAPYFNGVFKVLMVPVLALTTIGPQLGKPLKPLILPAATGILAAVAFWIWAVPDVWSGAILGLGVFNLGAIAQSSLPPLKSQAEGSAFAHGGMAMMMIAIAFVASLSGQNVYTLAPGETVQTDAGALSLQSLTTVPVSNYSATRATLRLDNGRSTKWLTPERRRYAHPAAEKPMPAIHASLTGDVYAVLGSRGKDGRVDIELIRHPGQIWIFIGMALMAMGGLLALSGIKRKRQKHPVSRTSSQFVRHTFGPVLPFILLLFLVAGFGQHFIHRLFSPPSEMHDVMLGKALPELSLPPAWDGQPWLKTSDIRGHVSIINIFASWCAPCREEAPLLGELKADVKIYGIAYRDTAAPLKTFLQQEGNPYTAIGMDSKGKAMMDFGAAGVPETFIVDKKGIIRGHYTGALDAATIRRNILPLLRKLQ